MSPSHSPASLFNLRELAIVITGAAGRVGAVVTESLHSMGARVFALDIDAAALAPLPATALEVDVTDAAAMSAAVERCATQAGRIDGLLCLIGGVHAGEFGPFSTDGLRTYDAIVDRNLRSAVVAHCAVAPHMIAVGGGSIVTVTAATALASAPFHGMYAAAKAALISLARTEAVEWGQYGIRVNTIAPGGIETRPSDDAMQRAERAAVPLGRRARPSDVANAAAYLLSDLSSYVTGQTLVLDGGALAKPAFLDADNVPVFVSDPALRERMRAAASNVPKESSAS